jgi:hypothetical protein
MPICISLPLELHLRLPARLHLLPLLAAPIFLTGCALTNTAAPTASTGHTIQGRVHGGRSPVYGAHIYLFGASSTVYGAPSTSLISSGSADGSDSLGFYVLSDSDGNFSVTGDYTCTTGTQVYLLATGGNPGLGTGLTNPNLALMTALGQCPASGTFASAIPHVSINEVTTVGSVYAIAGYMTDLTHVSSSSTALAKTGLANAFANVNNLVDIVGGGALTTTPAGNGTVPQAEINTLANILAACANTVGASSSQCSTLFSTAVEGSTQPTDTVTAILNIAHHPGVGISTIYPLGNPAPPFSPALGSAPNDFTIALSFSGGGLAAPDSVAIDAFGNVWAANYNSGVTELSSTGAPISPSTGFTGGGIAGPQFVAIDTSDNIWVPSFGSGLAKIDGSGAAISPSTAYTGGGLSGPYQSAIDASGNVWTINSPGYNTLAASSRVVKTNGSTGAPISGTNGYTGGGLNQAGAIAIDAAGYVWVANGGNNSISKLQVSNGAAISGTSGYTGGISGSPSAIAIDGLGNVWVADSVFSSTTFTFSSSIAQLNGSTGAAISPSAGYMGANGNPTGIAIDGLGNVWTTSNVSTTSYSAVLNGTTTIYSSNIFNLKGGTGAAISPSTGYTGGNANEFEGIAIDGSGNLWTANFDSNTLTEFIGIAAPVVTPLSAGVANSALGTRP